MTHISPVTGAPTETSAAKTSLVKDFDTFLGILTTQLQNQDPLAPMDSAEFTNQLVQFSALEQQIASNEKLDNLYASGTAVEAASAVQYLGKTVEIAKNVTFLADGAATLTYVLPGPSAETSITIYDQNGGVVRTLDGETVGGRTDQAWDGKNTQGIQVPDGTYTLAVSAKDPNGKALENILVYARGTAKEIVNDAGHTSVVVNDVSTPLSDVKAVTAAAN